MFIYLFIFYFILLFFSYFFKFLFNFLFFFAKLEILPQSEKIFPSIYLKLFENFGIKKKLNFFLMILCVSTFLASKQ